MATIHGMLNQKIAPSKGFEEYGRINEAWAGPPEDQRSSDLCLEVGQRSVGSDLPSLRGAPREVGDLVHAGLAPKT